MSVSTIAPLESALHTTNSWLNELAGELEWSDDPQRAYHALRAVLHALRNRLTVEEAADLGAQLPLMIRGIFYEGWTPHGMPVRERHKEAFLAHIEAAFPNDPQVFPEAVAWAVFKLLRRHISPGEIADVQGILPREIRALWPQGPVSPGPRA